MILRRQFTILLTQIILLAKIKKNLFRVDIFLLAQITNCRRKLRKAFFSSEFSCWGKKTWIARVESHYLSCVQIMGFQLPILFLVSDNDVSITNIILCSDNNLSITNTPLFSNNEVSVTNTHTGISLDLLKRK